MRTSLRQRYLSSVIVSSDDYRKLLMQCQKKTLVTLAFLLQPCVVAFEFLVPRVALKQLHQS